MTFGSLFSGIEGFGVGLERAGMKCVWQAEKDRDCLRVLRRHYPDVPKFTDVKEVNAASVPVRPDWICGGFPCQDLSVAGRRAGLAGERSGLFFEFMRIVGELTPGGVLIENVPGLLSSNEGRDMGTVLRALDERGYGWAYRCLDAQYFGLAQRRERVFIVGCLGDVRRAAEILFERESLPWDSAPSRQAGARTAACLTSGAATGSGVNRPGRRREDDTNIVRYALNAKNGKRFDGESETLIASTLTSRHTQNGHGAAGTRVEDIPNLIAANTFGGHRRKDRPEGGFYIEDSAEQTKCLDTGGNDPYRAQGGTCVHFPSGVRRLTPRECERLQGFPDDWTRYDDQGKEISDSARYRMLGNAVAVPCSEWIGERIA